MNGEIDLELQQSGNTDHKQEVQRRGRCCLGEGGVHGWSAVLGLWLSWFVWDGLVKSLSIMMPTLEVQLQTQAWVLGWIASIVDGVSDCSGPIADPLSKRTSTGNIVLICGIMLACGIIAASFVTNVVHLAVVLPVFAGTAIGISSVIARKAIGLHFTKRYVVASGVGMTGDSSALIVVPPLAHLLLTAYGWRGVLLLLGAFSWHLALCGVLLKRSKELPGSQPKSVPHEASLLLDTQTPTNANRTSKMGSRHPISRCAFLCRDVLYDFNPALFTNTYYWIILLISVSTANTLSFWRVYFVPHVVAKGVSLQDAAYYVTIAGIVSVIVKIVHGLLVDHGLMSCRTSLGIASLLSSIGLCIDPWMDSDWQILLCGIVVFPSIGVLYSLRDALTKELLGKDLMASAFGWFGLKSGILRIAVGFFPGLLYDCTGSYDLAFIVMGCIQALSLVSLACLKYVDRSSQKYH